MDIGPTFNSHHDNKSSNSHYYHIRRDLFLLFVYSGKKCPFHNKIVIFYQNMAAQNEQCLHFYVY